MNKKKKDFFATLVHDEKQQLNFTTKTYKRKNLVLYVMETSDLNVEQPYYTLQLSALINHQLRHISRYHTRSKSTSSENSLPRH